MLTNDGKTIGQEADDSGQMLGCCLMYGAAAAMMILAAFLYGC